MILLIKFLFITYLNTTLQTRKKFIKLEIIQFE